MKIGAAVWAGVGLLVISTPVAALADPVAILSLRSEPGDFVGQGQTRRLEYRRPTDPMIATVETFHDRSPAGLFFLLYQPAPNYHFASISFSTFFEGTPFGVGTYTNALGTGDASHPGMYIALEGRAPNAPTGSFTVSGLRFFQDSFGFPQLDHLRVAFEQHSEGAGPALFGSLAYDFDPSPVPEPATLLLFGTGGVGLLARRRARVHGARTER